MGLNIAHIKTQVARVIDSAPISCEYFRTTFVSDGFGGKVATDDLLSAGSFTGLLDNTGTSELSVIANDAGNSHDDGTPKLYVLYDGTFNPKVNDFFMYDGHEYKFANCINVLDLNIVWMIPLSLKAVKVNGI